MPPKIFKNKTQPFKKTSEFLIIVESPSKCSKIESFLGSNYQCIASKGHLRTITSLKSIHLKETLPIVSPETTSTPPLLHNNHIDFTIIKEKQEHIDFMQNVISQFSYKNILLATDADREGEAIAWHICDIFKLPIETTPRIIFHEITPSAILKAVQNPVFINMKIVHSQKARQILDLFVGFKISPYLWKYIFSSKSNSLSAGRCQTPCLRLVYDNEKEREKQQLEIIYKTTASFFQSHTQKTFLLNHEFKSKEQINDFLNMSKTHDYKMTIGSPKESAFKPPKPFSTSRLLQIANNILNLSPKQTMALCQVLYQEGYITYMRTDSNQYSKEFLNKASEFVTNNWGKSYIGSLDNLENKDHLNPHEAIRVTHLETNAIPLDKEPKLNSLYKLIWKNTIESCMSDSTYKQIQIKITAPQEYSYIHSIEIPLFLGWKKASEFVTKKSLTDNQTQDSSFLIYLETLLRTNNKTLASHSSTSEFSVSAPSATPPLLQIYPQYINSVVHVHSPNKHYTEATLIQKLEELGIGRPSTFSMLIETIQERGYVKKMDLLGEPIQCIDFCLKDNVLTETFIERIFGNEKNKLVIQPIGILTIEFLILYFNNLFSYDYTKKMEEELDNNINPFSICNDCNNNIREQSKNIISIEKQTYPINEEYELVFQKFGPVLRKRGTTKDNIETLPTVSPEFSDSAPSSTPHCFQYKSIRKDINLDLEKLKRNEYKIDDLLEISNEILGIYENHNVYLRTGIYGPYIEWNDKKESIKHIEKPLNTIILNDVLSLINPNDENYDSIRKLPSSGQNILRRIDDQFSIRKGKFGPYIYYKTSVMGSPEFYSLKGFKEGFNTCESNTLKNWIKEKYNVPR